MTAFTTNTKPRISTVCMLPNSCASATSLCRVWTQSCAGFLMLLNFQSEIPPSVLEQAGTGLCSNCKGSWQRKSSGFHLKSEKMPKVHCRTQVTSAVPCQKESSESRARGCGGVTPKLVFPKLGGNYRRRETKMDLPIKLRVQSDPSPPLLMSSLWLLSFHPRPPPTPTPLGCA